MFFILKIKTFDFKQRNIINLALIIRTAQTFCCHYAAISARISQPILFRYNLKNNFIKKNRKKFLKLKSERGVFAFHHRLKQVSDEILTEDKEYFSNDRSCFLTPDFFYNLSMYTGVEYKLIPAGSFKVIPTIQRGFDYFTNYSRKEDIFYYQDSIFQFKKNKLGEYVFTKRTGSMIHIIKKKK